MNKSLSNKAPVKQGQPPTIKEIQVMHNIESYIFFGAIAALLLFLPLGLLLLFIWCIMKSLDKINSKKYFVLSYTCNGKRLDTKDKGPISWEEYKTFYQDNDKITDVLVLAEGKKDVIVNFLKELD